MTQLGSFGFLALGRSLSRLREGGRPAFRLAQFDGRVAAGTQARDLGLFRGVLGFPRCGVCV